MPASRAQPRRTRAAAAGRRLRSASRCSASPAPATPPLQQAPPPSAERPDAVWPPPALLRTARLGVLGGGQLGRMLGLAAAPLGVRLSFLDPQPGAPACAAAAQVVGSFLAPSDVASFAAGLDALTVELEHVDAAAMAGAAAAAAAAGRPLACAPSPACVALLQDKLRQRRHFAAAAASPSSSSPPSSGGCVAQPRFAGPLRCAADAEAAAASLGFPLVLKRRRGSYDGNGNAVARSAADLPRCAAALGGYGGDGSAGVDGAAGGDGNGGNEADGGIGGGALYAEEYLPLLCELAVMVARGADGELAVYPVAETVQRAGVCAEVHVPPRWLAWRSGGRGVDGGDGGGAHATPATAAAAAAAAATDALAAAATALALRAVAALPGAGVFGVEMFVAAVGGDASVLPSSSSAHGGTPFPAAAAVLLNEVAPRPHNSGHYTIDACDCSQFEQQARAALGWPLGSGALAVGAASMLNVLGDAAAGEGGARRLFAAALGVPGARGHSYGKSWRAGRKLGHITVTGPTPASVARRLAALRAAAAAGDGAAAAVAAAAGGGGDAAASAAAEATGLAATAAALRQPQPGLQPSAASAAAAAAPPAPLVGVIMGSDSDLGVMGAACRELASLGVPFEVTVVSAHRTPDRLAAYARSAAPRGLRVVIAGAGGAAHLPGMVASHTTLPVIGVPVPLRGGLAGVDSLLSIVQMPAGIPVATVGIGAAANAGLLAARVLALGDDRLAGRLAAHAAALEAAVLAKAERLERVGWEAYLDGAQ